MYAASGCDGGGSVRARRPVPPRRAALHVSPSGRGRRRARGPAAHVEAGGAHRSARTDGSHVVPDPLDRPRRHTGRRRADRLAVLPEQLTRARRSPDAVVADLRRRCRHGVPLVDDALTVRVAGAWRHPRTCRAGGRRSAAACLPSSARERRELRRVDTGAGGRRAGHGRGGHVRRALARRRTCSCPRSCRCRSGRASCPWRRRAPCRASWWSRASTVAAADARRRGVGAAVVGRAAVVAGGRGRRRRSTTCCCCRRRRARTPRRRAIASTRTWK